MTANEAALAAAVEAALEGGHELHRVMDAYPYSTEPRKSNEVDSGRAAFRELLTRQREREKQWREFVEGFIAEQPTSDRVDGFCHWADKWAEFAKEAAALLAELGGDESEGA